MTRNVPFVLEEVVGDGYCIAGILERFAREQLEYKKKSNAFCGTLAEAALKSVKRVQSELGEDGVERSVVDALKRLQKTRSRVNLIKSGLWQEIEVQHLLFGFISMFCDAKVTVYGVSKFGWVIRQDGSYGNGEKELHVLQWKMREHYDRLLKIGY